MRALVTGGGRGLGREVACSLSRSGWNVTITGRDFETLDDAVAAGDAHLALPGDATDRDAVAAAVEAAGPLDLVVANAGRFGTGGALWQTDPDDWWRDVEVNLRSVALALWAALPGMVERGSGRVIALGSGFGNTAAAYGTGYGVSKAAVHRLVESVALELAGTGVTAFSVSPGRVRTDMTLGFPKAFTDAHPAMLEPPAGGWAPPEALTALVSRIASGELDALSGRFLHVTADLPTAPGADEGTLRLVGW
jgi:NAD(P)-dependent dehydrogenase (short-subunit alcohol dehydrogenase family)